MSDAAISRGPRNETELYSFRLEFRDEHGASIRDIPLSAADFERAVHEAWFEAFRAGIVSTCAPGDSEARIVPRFQESDQSACSHGFSVLLTCPDGNEYSTAFPLGYFQALASTARATLQRDSQISTGGTLYYTLGAYLEDTTMASRDALPVSFDPPSVHLPVREVARTDWQDAETWDTPGLREMTVIVSRALIEDGYAEACRYADREIGGLLLGHLCQDPGTSEVFLLVTCLVSGEGTTEATRTSVTFTPDSFARARELIRLRASPGEPPEIVVGWFHSHPFRFCDQCPLPTPTECIQKVLFYSTDDIQLMSSTFGQPFMIGLLAAVEPKLETALGHLPVRLYGWQQGEIIARGFHVSDM